MKITVRVVPNAKENRIVKESEEKLRVYIREKPREGRANKALIELLSEFFGAEKSRIRIVKGLKSREKVVEIADYEK